MFLSMTNQWSMPDEMKTDNELSTGICLRTKPEHFSSFDEN